MTYNVHFVHVLREQKVIQIIYLKIGAGVEKDSVLEFLKKDGTQERVLYMHGAFQVSSSLCCLARELSRFSDRT